MAAPRFRIFRKTKKGKKGTDGTCGVIWLQDGGFLSLQLHAEANAKFKQVAFGTYDPENYFYNVYENTPRAEVAEPDEDDGPDPDEESDF